MCEALEGGVIAAPGATMPDGDLVDINGEPATLSGTRDGRPAVVVFYAGEWCPYCNRTLQIYAREIAPILRSRGVALIAISAEPPDGSLAMQEVLFDVLSDEGNTIARRLGIMAPQDAEHAHDGATVSLRATVVVDAAGLIRWIDVPLDHLSPAEPSTILRALDVQRPSGVGNEGEVLVH
jgi:peroxiredoxin